MFQVQHYRKIKTAVGLRNVIAHNMREKVYDDDGQEIENKQTSGEWYAPERGYLNEYSEKSRNPDYILKKRADRIKDAGLKRKPQKNSAHAIEGTFSASAGWHKDWKNSEEDRAMWDKYLKDTQQWLEKSFGKENILHMSVHYDETSPHLHALFVPIMKNKKGDITYSSGNYLGGATGLKTLQTEYNRSVGQKYGLQRGIDGSRATHKYMKGVQEDKARINEKSYLLQEDLPKNLEPGMKRTRFNEKEWLRQKLANTESYAKDLESQRNMFKYDLSKAQLDNKDLRKKLEYYDKLKPHELRKLADERTPKPKDDDNERGGTTASAAAPQRAADPVQNKAGSPPLTDLEKIQAEAKKLRKEGKLPKMALKKTNKRSSKLR